jgi:arsenite oxidase small subunit
MASADEANGKRRRNFLKIILAAGWVSAIAAAASVLRYLAYIPPTSTAGGTTQLSWPRIKIANIKSLQQNNALKFNYPLVNSASMLLKLGTRVKNGVGPDGDIVAYSMICQHLGCYVAFQAPGTSPPCDASYKAPVAEGYCCCHGGVYDFTKGAAVISGPPPRAVPAVQLEYDETTGDVYAIGMTAPTIFGHGTPGTTDPNLVLKNDLEGGEIVTQDTIFSGV